MKKNRIAKRFEDLAARGEKGFVAYITAGDPDLDATVERVRALEAWGADVIELGIPFSDPLADGVANQRAAERALKAGATLDGIFRAVARIREFSEIPIIFFSYLNPLFAKGFDCVADRATEVGVDGMLLVDMCLEESEPFQHILQDRGLDHVVLVTPTTPESRVAGLVRKGSGFVYCVSRAGVTGEQSELQKDAREVLDRTRRHTGLPRALGFGVSTPEQAAAYAGMCEAVVVGSFLVNTFHEAGNTPAGLEAAGKKIRPLIDAVKGSVHHE